MKNTPNPQPTLSARLDEAIAQVEYHQKRLDDMWGEFGVHVQELRFWQMRKRELERLIPVSQDAFKNFIKEMRDLNLD